MIINNNDNDNSFEKSDIYDDYQYVWGSNSANISHDSVSDVKKKRKKRPLIVISISVVVIIALVFSAISISRGKGWLINKIKPNNFATIEIPIQTKPQIEEQYYDESTGRYTAQGIAKRVLPSVVSIEIYEKGIAFTPTAQGSGIILTADGYIMTNAHVVENASRAIKVILNDESKYEAVLVGIDKRTDLAVIKITAKDLVAADIGDSDELEIGEDIIALGSPAGLSSSLTKGVVSGLNRKVSTEPQNIQMDCIQIDAAINPGNSGGALVNMYGQVVGINTSKYASDDFDGIGFAISMKAAAPIIEELISDGYIKGRVRVGITFTSIDATVAKENDTEPGLYIVSISSACDISKTELKENDTITHINGKAVSDSQDVADVLKGLKPGDEVTAKVFRKSVTGEKSNFDIKFKLMEDSAISQESPSSSQ